MSESKMVKAVCKKTGISFGLEVKRYGSDWKVVNAVRLSDDEARVLTSEVKCKSRSHSTTCTEF